MPGKNLSQVSTFATSLNPNDLFYLVDSSLSLSSDRKGEFSLMYKEMHFPYVYIGTNGKCQYSTITDAIAAGEIYLFISTDITETVSTTISGNLFVKVLPGININFVNATPFVFTAGQHEFAIFSEGTYNLNYNFSSDSVLFDLSAVVASPPAYFGGQPIFQNVSPTGVNVTPIKTNPGNNYLVNIDSIIYLMNDSPASQFSLAFADIKQLVLVNAAGGSNIFGLQITDFGSITNLVVGSDLPPTSIIADVNNTVIANFLSLSNVGAAQLYIKNGSVLNGASINNSTLVSIDTDTDTKSSQISNFKNVNLVLSGYDIKVMNCDCASFNGNGVSGGVQTIMSSRLSGGVTVDNTLSQQKFSLCSFEQGLNIQNAFCALIDGCTAGDTTTPGTSYTITLGTGSNNCFVSNCFVDDDIVNNGINNSYTYKLF